MAGDPIERERVERDRDPASRLPLHRHGLGFLASGLLAFAVDAAVLAVGVRVIGADPLQVRVLSISLAMVVGWLAHRRWTFAIRTPPAIAEFGRYAIAGWLAALVNYGLFALQLLVFPAIPELAALVPASAGSMVFSYLAMRYSVFTEK